MFKRFKNRDEAAKTLGKELLRFKSKDSVVVAIPRGGVVIAYEIAEELNAPLDLIIPRKLGSPGNPELALGAVTEDGTTILNDNLVTELEIPRSYIESEKEMQIKEIRRRMRTYKGEEPPVELQGKTVILVDDGIATGATMKAAISSIKKSKPSAIIVAAPVAPPSTVEELKRMVDDVVCPVVFEPFFAIGQFYEEFDQVSDEEVIKIIKGSRKDR
jgi:putative phosphoribosyl transferase